MRIICIDDEKLILELTVSMCRELPQKPEVRGFNNSADALAYIRNYKVDIAIMDINMPDMSGIIMAAKMKEINKNVAIIFLTGYSEYALDAISMHASGYLMKPVSSERLKEEIDYAIENIELHKYNPKNTNIFVRTFGRFDVLLDGEPISFQRSRSKELLAYLVDRHGSFVSRVTAFSILWENRTYDRPMQKHPFHMHCPRPLVGLEQCFRLFLFYQIPLIEQQDAGYFLPLQHDQETIQDQRIRIR